MGSGLAGWQVGRLASWRVGELAGWRVGGRRMRGVPVSKAEAK